MNPKNGIVKKSKIMSKYDTSTLPIPLLVISITHSWGGSCVAWSEVRKEKRREEKREEVNAVSVRHIIIYVQS